MKRLFYFLMDLFKKKSEQETGVRYCDGCGGKFYYPLHDCFGYISCSKQCDEILEEVFEDQ